MSDRVQDLTNHRKVAVACKNYTDKEIKASEERILSIVARNNVSYIDHTDEATYRFTAPANAKLLMLQNVAGNSVKYSPSVVSDITTAYQKNVPSYSPSVNRATASINTLGGMSYKCNNLFNINSNSFVSVGTNYTASGDTLTTNSKPSYLYLKVSVKADTDYYINCVFSGTTNLEVFDGNITSLLTTSGNTFNSGSNTEIAVVFYPDGVYSNIMLNEGTTALPYEPYFEGIRDTAPTCVVSKDSNNTALDTLSINASIQALDGYGWGIDDTYYNYIDFNAKKFVKKVGRVDLGSLDYTRIQDGDVYYFASVLNDAKLNGNGRILKYSFILYTQNDIANILTSDKTFTITGQYYSATPRVAIRDDSYSTAEAFKTAMSCVYLYYELATPVETDISQYLTTNEIEIEPNGTLSFESTYSAYVPSNVSYNGVIKHALATAIKHESFNIWDEDWEVGTINLSTGENVSNNTCIRSKNYIPIISNTEYFTFVKQDNSNLYYYVIFYDNNNNFISSQTRYCDSANNYADQKFTTPSNCSFVRFYVADVYGTTYNNDICINISNASLNGTYKPYKAPITRLLPNSEAKYSWGITDGVRNTRVFCDDEGNAVNEGGLVVGNQDLGGINYTNYYQGLFLSSDINDMVVGTQLDTPNILCEKYTTDTDGHVFNRTTDKTITIQYTQQRLFVYDTTYTNIPLTLKPSLVGVPLFYEKNTTDTETLDDFDYFFDCEEGDTFTIIGCELLQCYATYSFLIKEAKTNE